MKKQLLILTLCLAAVFSVNRVTAQFTTFFDIPVDTSTTYDQLIAKFGEPKDISGREGEFRALYYHLNVADDYMYGWMVINVNSKNKYCGFSLKAQQQCTPTERTLNYFKTKFGLPEEMIALFSLSEKELKEKLKTKGYSMEKRETRLDFINLFGVKQLPAVYNDIEIEFGKGKSFEKSKVKDKIYTRQDRIYKLTVTYSNRFQ